MRELPSKRVLAAALELWIRPPRFRHHEPPRFWGLRSLPTALERTMAPGTRMALDARLGSPYPSRLDPAYRRCARWPNGSRRRRRAARHRPGIRRASTPVRIARGWPAPWRLPHHGSGPCAGAALLRLSCAAAPYGRPCRRRRTGRLRGRSAALIVIKC